jgi:hypothetical protein
MAKKFAVTDGAAGAADTAPNDHMRQQQQQQQPQLRQKSQQECPLLDPPADPESTFEAAMG